MTRTVRGILTLLGLSVLSDVPSPAAPPVVLEPKHNVRVVRNVLIPMRDGTKLAADLIRPEAKGRYPVIIEYIPYRKDDLTQGGYDAHHYFAERGFVGVRLDVRGTGGSEGVNTDEYMPIEQKDGFDAVEWCAKQPWSNGNVGMFGTSYGGFTCIQVAMHRPPHLKAIVPMYATDDRYTDDCHYTPGGNMRMYYDVGTYGGTMVAMNALPPYPEFAGPRWAELWKQRLEENQPYLLTWMKHQVDGPYWRSASLRPEYDRVQCPVFLIGGWRDGYANTMLRTYTQLKGPKRLLMGPWVHSRPNSSVPGPRIDYLNEVSRFFAHWLRDEDTGFMKQTPVTVYMQEYARPERTLDITPGSWRNLDDLSAEARTFYLHEGHVLAERPGGATAYDEFKYIPTVGLANGYWSAGGISFYLADDQRADEAYSLVYTTSPLEEDIRLLGWPRVLLHASSSAKVATFVAKLADVAPDGSSALIVDGSLNGTRRKSLTNPEPMTPGEVYELDIPMNPTGWVIKKGHRLRLAVSGADFPNLWPTPEKARQRIHRGFKQPSRVILPVVSAAKREPPEFLPPPRLARIVQSSAKPPRQQVIHDQITGAVTVVNRTESTIVLPDNRGELTGQHSFHCTASAKDPAQASIIGTHTFVLKREDGTFEVSAESTIRATATAFHITINLNVTRNGKSFFQKQWMVSEPRRLL
jgi:putative CocE/NonD family hydrolase